jgi:predicted O-methyltransferase YrrM
MEFDSVARAVGGIGQPAASTPAEGARLYEFVLRSGVSSILELGFAHGNSACYMAAALDERGRGDILTIDREKARELEPNIGQLVTRLGLDRYVTPIFAERSYTWELMKLIKERSDHGAPEPLFDFCFIDGAHSWEVDGLAFFLVDKLLRPGGWILFDDVHWTYESSHALRDRDWVRELPEEERRTPQVMMVFALLVMQHPGYGDFLVRGNWAWARKTPPAAEVTVTPNVVEGLYAVPPS